MYRNNLIKTNIAKIKILILVGLFLLFGRQLNGQEINCTFDKTEKKTICKVAEVYISPSVSMVVPKDKDTELQITEKSPFDDCAKGKITYTDNKQTDAFTTFLQIFTLSSTGIKVPGLPAKATDLNSTPAEKLYQSVRSLAKNITDKFNDSETLINNQKVQGKPLKDAITSPPRKSGDLDPNLATNLKGLYDGSHDWSIEAEKAFYNVLVKQLKDVSNDPLVPKITEELDIIVVLINQLEINYNRINATRLMFKTAYERLTETGDLFTAKINIRRSADQTANTSVTCSNIFTQKPSSPEMAVAISFSKIPKFSVSVGPVVSTIPKQKLGTTAINTGNGTFKSVFAVTDHAKVQIIPFAFINYQLMGFGSNRLSIEKKVTLNFSAGIGVNPNNGSNEVEYMFGLGVGFKKFMIIFGDHFGRFQKDFSGGFNVGDTVPASFPSNLPIHKVYKQGFGIAFTYKLTP